MKALKHFYYDLAIWGPMDLPMPLMKAKTGGPRNTRD
jgi:hypothetical protein